MRSLFALQPAIFRLAVAILLQQPTRYIKRWKINKGRWKIQKKANDLNGFLFKWQTSPREILYSDQFTFILKAYFQCFRSSSCYKDLYLQIMFCWSIWYDIYISREAETLLGNNTIFVSHNEDSGEAEDGGFEQSHLWTSFQTSSLLYRFSSQLEFERQRRKNCVNSTVLCWTRFIGDFHCLTFVETRSENRCDG